MQPDGFAFADVFQVDDVSGRITLGSNRHLVLDAVALGTLRQEFIDNLGWEVSRGIFTRLGYQCGRRDASQWRRYRPLPPDDGSLPGAMLMGQLQGMAGTRLEKFEVDRAGGKVRILGEWLDSFEVEYHLQHHGIGNRSVCWTLEGYGSGFASEYLGMNVLCMETHCRGKGEPACKFEARSEADWGENARPLKELIAGGRFVERFDRCLRIIRDMGCELEQTSLDAVFTTDAKGVVTSCSEGASVMLGVSPSEAVGKHVSTFYAGGKSEAFSIMERLREQRRFRDYMTEFVTPNGRRTPVILSASAIRNRLGHIVATIGVAHDLSKIRRLEDELAGNNRFMANILRDSADAIITLDPNDVVTSWNKGAERIFGYLAGEMIGKSISILVPPDLLEAGEVESISRKFRSQGEILSHQTERLTKDGRRIQVIFTRTAIRDESGRIIGSSSVIKDVTSIRNLEKQLAEAEHLASLGELSAGLAHEIKNPLAGIKGAIEVIRHSFPESAAQQQVLGDVLHEVERIDKIVRDLLNYAKPRPVSHGPVDLPALARRMVLIAAASFKEGASRIEFHQRRQIPQFTGDETQLEQVVLNLLLNALHVIPPEGHIEVVLDYDEDTATVKLEVRDDGPGIPDSIQKKIFQPFFTTRTGGVGLGLATCLRNVQYHGGTIDVRSEAGHGTTFVVCIPLLCPI